MEIGYGLFTTQQHPDDDRPAVERYDDVCRLARAVEDAGLDSAWVTEHHFAADDHLSATMPTLAALARETETIDVGTCVALAPLYDPVRFAEDAAAVDLLSRGRLVTGVGLGYLDREFEAFGVPKAERVPRTVDAVRLVRSAWSEGPIEYDSDYHPIQPGTAFTPKPTRGRIPVPFGGAADPAVRRAARLGDGWMAPTKLSVDEIADRVATIREIREEEGLDGEFQQYAVQYGFVGDSREDAWAAMKDGYLHMHRQYVSWRTGRPVDDLPPERSVEALKRRAVFGSPAQVASELDRYREALGDDGHLVFRAYVPGVETDRLVECIERLGDEVAPTLR